MCICLQLRSYQNRQPFWTVCPLLPMFQGFNFVHMCPKMTFSFWQENWRSPVKSLMIGFIKKKGKAFTFEAQCVYKRVLKNILLFLRVANKKKKLKLEKLMCKHDSNYKLKFSSKVDETIFSEFPSAEYKLVLIHKMCHEIVASWFTYTGAHEYKNNQRHPHFLRFLGENKSHTKFESWKLDSSELHSQLSRWKTVRDFWIWFNDSF